MQLWPATIVLLAAASLAWSGTDDAPMIYIPAGEFTMGTTRAEAAALAKGYNVHPSFFRTECPQREVSVKAFWIDAHPVTNAQFKRCVDAGKARPPANWGGKTYPTGAADHPVAAVNWQQAKAYADWVGKRLPTEAEWEKAARGTDGRVYPWGNEWDPQATRIDDGTSPQTRALTVPVGSFPKGKSPYGVLDMCGNVAEWTGTPTRKPNPQRPTWGWYAVKGAGAAHSLRGNFRCAARNFSAHNSRWHPWLGFRCAKDAPAQAPATGAAFPPAKPLAPVPPTEGPREDLYGARPIRISSHGWHGAVFHAPQFPLGAIGSNMPEQIGARGVALSWSEIKTPLRWHISDDGTKASYSCTWPDKATLTVTLESSTDYVDFTLALRNLTDKPFKGVQSNTCFNPSHSPYFADIERLRTYVWTDAGPTRAVEMPCGTSGEYLHGGWPIAKPGQKAPKGGRQTRYPFIAVASRDGKWVLAQAYDKGLSLGNNAHYTCLHTRPTWDDIAPGQEGSRRGRLYFLRGDVEDLLERWKRDFGE